MTAKHTIKKRPYGSKKETLVLDDKRNALFVTVKHFVDDLIYSIDVDADYQREEVWSRTAKEKLLDSILKGIDIPKLYLFEFENIKKTFSYECIDGKQRMLTLFSFFHPDVEEDNPLKVEVSGKKYSYEKLEKELPHEAKKIESYKLEFIVYKEKDDFSDAFVRDIFQRLQLGIRLNSGELLNAHTGVIRDFIFKDKNKKIPFLSNTKLSNKRFSRQFTLAQICINSIYRTQNNDFTRARLLDLETFFNSDIKDLNSHLSRITKVLELMDKSFTNDEAGIISSRAVAVSAYLFVEKLYLDQKTDLIPKFAGFYKKLLNSIRDNLSLLNEYKPIKNQVIIEEFQKYISQASVEPYSLRRRQNFLAKAFDYYLSEDTKGKIIGNK